ncbi:MAG: DUF2270 domain-containing protein [Myxococcaceae bacterium]
MAHLYRGELGRSDRWRTRLDTTSNWALTTTAAVISFAFATPNTPHVTVLVGLWMVVTFLRIEARRYRYFDLWNRRVRLLEDGYWSPLLRREPVDPDALKELALEMERPQLQLSYLSAIATRMNRAYGALLLILLLSWFVKLYTHPAPPQALSDLVHRAHVGPLPGWLVMIAVGTFAVGCVVLFAASMVSRAPLGELRTRPHTRRQSMWEMLYRPYELRQPRRRTLRTRKTQESAVRETSH